MAGELEELKALLSSGDLAQYAENEVWLNHALSYAASEINKRRGYIPESSHLETEPQYRVNTIEGAIWRLSRIGGEGYDSTSENGVSIKWKEVPEWLASVKPKLGVLK